MADICKHDSIEDASDCPAATTLDKTLHAWGFDYVTVIRDLANALTARAALRKELETLINEHDQHVWPAQLRAVHDGGGWTKTAHLARFLADALAPANQNNRPTGAPGGVHNHGPYDGPGTGCPEYLIGNCRIPADQSDLQFHRPNTGGTYCRQCREPWPCPFVPAAAARDRIVELVWKARELDDPNAVVDDLCALIAPADQSDHGHPDEVCEPCWKAGYDTADQSDLRAAAQEADR